MQAKSCSQRVCSTKTRIKTLTNSPNVVPVNLKEYVPLKQGLRLYNSSLRCGARFIKLKEYVPLKQGLFQFSDNLYFYQKAIRLYLFYAIK